MTTSWDHRALAGALPGGVPRGPLPPARSLCRRACCRAIHRVVDGLDPRRTTPIAMWRLPHRGA
eukprot:5953633-Lingulodinium_polyedra.AAC.1